MRRARQNPDRGLSRIIATLRALHWVSSSAHWKIQGNYGDHLLFERVYNTALKGIDPLVERLIGYEGAHEFDEVAVSAKAQNLIAPGKNTIESWVERVLSLERQLQIAVEDALRQNPPTGLRNFLEQLLDDHSEIVYLLQQRSSVGASRAQLSLTNSGSGLGSAEALRRKVEDFAYSLRTWNLKHEYFPSLDAWLDKHWNAPYGREQAYAYLSSVMRERSDNYWNVPSGRNTFRDREDARKAFRNIMNDLAGDGSLEAARNPRSRNNTGPSPLTPAQEMALLTAVREAVKAREKQGFKFGRGYTLAASREQLPALREAVCRRDPKAFATAWTRAGLGGIKDQVFDGIVAGAALMAGAGAAAATGAAGTVAGTSAFLSTAGSTLGWLLSNPSEGYSVELLVLKKGRGYFIPWLVASLKTHVEEVADVTTRDTTEGAEPATAIRVWFSGVFPPWGAHSQIRRRLDAHGIPLVGFTEYPFKGHHSYKNPTRGRR